MAAMNDNACTEILLRLPVKSVIRFKSVSKRWLSLISTPHFRRLHTLRGHKPPPSLIIASHNSKFLYFNPCDTANPTKMIPFTITRPNYPKIVSSCNGLLLLYDHHTKYEDLHVYNPATKQSRQLNLAHNDDKSSRVVELHLVFDPSVSIHYKVVCIRAGLVLEMQTYKMEVFDSETGNWNVCKEPFTSYTRMQGEMQGIELNSGSTVLHLSNMIFGISLIHHQSLYCFDIDRNTLSFLKCPKLAIRERAPYFEMDGFHMPNSERAPHSQMLQVSNGCLYYVSVQFDCESVAIWELQLQRDDPCRSPWQLKYHDTLCPPRSCYAYAGRWTPTLLRFITETSTLLMHVYGNIVAYNFVDKSYSELLGGQRSHLSCAYFNEFCRTSLDVHQFAETLALL